MSQTVPVNAVTAQPGDGSRQVHVIRKKWEENWLALRRETSAVIDYASWQRGRPVDSASGHEATRPAMDVTQAVVPVQPREEAAAPLAGHSIAQIAEQALVTQPALRNHGMTVAQGAVPPRVQAYRAATAAHAERGRTSPQHALRTSVFWSSQCGIEGAMRLREPERSAGSVLRQLREWLRSRGTHLRRLLINGQVILHSDPPATRTPASRAPAAVPHIKNGSRSDASR